MKSSCRFAMALHVLALLAYREGDRATSAFLANSVNTNPVIIRRLLLVLQRARLVETCKGAGAGSRLARSPRRISLADIYRAVDDGQPFATPASNPNTACPVGKCMRETFARVVTSAKRAMERDLEQTSLRDVVEAARRARLP